ncbi:hypothetical protein BDL97_04G026100 [Sphagnum fallax]|nr:hypothetical protein BDL97_04G026100 [Sphagnum fallax]
MSKGVGAGGGGGGGGGGGSGSFAGAAAVVAGPTVSAAAQAAQRQRSLLQRADADIGSLLDNFSHLLKAARINDPVRNAQEAFQMEVHAARVAADSLLKLVSELKQAAVFSDFLTLNRHINQQIVKFAEQSEETERLLVTIGDEVAECLGDLETHYYSSPHRNLDTLGKMPHNASNEADGA